MDGNNERQPSPQPPDDGAAANIVDEEAANNGQPRNARPLAQINRNEGYANVLTPALTILAYGTSHIRQLSALFDSKDSVLYLVQYRI